MRAGHGSIGKVEVDCRFMFTKSQWGVIGAGSAPGGIIYLDLDFNQPADCKLASATITVTLMKADGDEPDHPDGNPSTSVYPIQFTDHYGPKCVRGQESWVQTKKVKHRTPEVQMFGYGGGGLGNDKERVVQTHARWDFSGHIGPATKDDRWYNCLQWKLAPNSLEWAPTHNHLFHTAFALQHDAERFYMTVHVSGKLAKFSDKFSNKLKNLKFGDKGGRDQEIVTKIEWADGYSCPRRLDKTAEGLRVAMEYANMAIVPAEIPGAMNANYHPAITTNPVSGTEPAQHHDQDQPLLSNLPQTIRPPLPPLGHHPWLTSSAFESSMGMGVAETVPTVGGPMQNLPGLVLEDLDVAGTASPQQPRPTARPPGRPPAISTSQPPTISTPQPLEANAEELLDVGPPSTVTLVNSAVSVREGEKGEAEKTNTLLNPKGERQRVRVGKIRDQPPKNINGNGAIWLGITAVLLHWFGQLGVLLLSWRNLSPPDVISAVTVPETPVSKREKSRSKSKTKKLKLATESGYATPEQGARAKTSAGRSGLVYPRGRLRGRRPLRAYLAAEASRSRPEDWEDV
ncbi:hypothetical protein B0J18DRAFT_363069 [Chaetomium sp. MPI-SDFR-AT-0129]|nr:hypothetical protein B0J18DRAFT_363069 [Chaetomium sp. MPI-SDFR-AT-0129]